MTVARYYTQRLLPVLESQKEEGKGAVFVTPNGEDEADFIFQTYKNLLDFYKFPWRETGARCLMVQLPENEELLFRVVSYKYWMQDGKHNGLASVGKLVFRG